MFGVYDTRGNCWLGKPTGPHLFDNERDAVMAAKMLNDRFRSSTRVVAREYDDSGNSYGGEVHPESSGEGWQESSGEEWKHGY